MSIKVNGKTIAGSMANVTSIQCMMWTSQGYMNL